MRRRRRNRKKSESEVNLTPMLDVVFIMLIFFIVTASFVKESGIEITRPGASTAVRPLFLARFDSMAVMSHWFWMVRPYR